eukprot:204101-Chlamydomonas_euryale.AAC.1
MNPTLQERTDIWTRCHRGRGAHGPGTKPRPIASSCVAMRAASRRAARGCIRSSQPELGAWCWWSEEWMAC